DPSVPQNLGCGDGVLVVAEHVAWTLDQDLAVVRDLDLDPGKRLADREELVLAQGVRANARRGLSHAPSVEDGHSDRPEELLDVARQARAAADEEPQPASRQSLAKRGQNEAIRELVPDAQPGARHPGVK